MGKPPAPIKEEKPTVRGPDEAGDPVRLLKRPRKPSARAAPPPEDMPPRVRGIAHTHTPLPAGDVCEPSEPEQVGTPRVYLVSFYAIKRKIADLQAHYIVVSM